MRLTEQAKALIVQKQRDRALLLLKLKRFKEKEVADIDNQLMSVLQMIDTVEWESANMEVLKALKTGTTALNKLHEEMSVDDVAALLDETNEAIEVENQINSLLAGQLSTYDSEELEAELTELMGESTSSPAKEQPTVDVTPTEVRLDLPTVPTHQLAAREQPGEVERVLVAS